jgi:hypothetical protein
MSRYCPHHEGKCPEGCRYHRADLESRPYQPSGTGVAFEPNPFDVETQILSPGALAWVTRKLDLDSGGVLGAYIASHGIKQLVGRKGFLIPIRDWTGEKVGEHMRLYDPDPWEPKGRTRRLHPSGEMMGVIAPSSDAFGPLLTVVEDWLSALKVAVIGGGTAVYLNGATYNLVRHMTIRRYYQNPINMWLDPDARGLAQRYAREFDGLRIVRSKKDPKDSSVLQILTAVAHND